MILYGVLDIVKVSLNNLVLEKPNLCFFTFWQVAKLSPSLSLSPQVGEAWTMLSTWHSKTDVECHPEGERGPKERTGTPDVSRQKQRRSLPHKARPPNHRSRSAKGTLEPF